MVTRVELAQQQLANIHLYETSNVGDVEVLRVPEGLIYNWHGSTTFVRREFLVMDSRYDQFICAVASGILATRNEKTINKEIIAKIVNLGYELADQSDIE